MESPWLIPQTDFDKRSLKLNDQAGVFYELSMTYVVTMLREKKKPYIINQAQTYKQ